MSPLLPAALLAGCVLLATTGLAMLRGNPRGTDALLAARSADVAAGRPPRAAGLRLRLTRRVSHWVLAGLSERRAQQLRHRIDAAGRPDGLTLDRYLERRVATTAAAGAVGAAMAVALGSVIVVPAALCLGWAGYDQRMAGVARRRQERIDRDLPDFLDVLAITVQAGSGFHTAMERVASSLPGPVSEEVQTTLGQMSLGAGRRPALEALRDRNDSEGLSQLVSALLQAEELGSPLGEAIQGIAADMRQTFAQQARQRAAKAVPRVSLVVVALIVPGAALLLLGSFLLSMDFGFAALFS